MKGSVEMKTVMSMVSPSSLRPIMWRTTALAGFAAFAATVTPAQAQVCDPTVLPVVAGCEAGNAGRSLAVPVQPNTEVPEAVSIGAFGAEGFSISIDNRTVAGAPAPSVSQRTNDLRNDSVSVDVRFDGLDSRRFLNVATADLRDGYAAGETVTFRASTNYPAYLASAEILIRDRSRRGAPVVATLPVRPNGTANYIMPTDGQGAYSYALRVYDPTGRYNETNPVAFTRIARSPAVDTTGFPSFAAAGEGDDNTARRGIPVRGGTVTVSGTATPGGTVTVMGESVPVDGNGRFAVSRVLPAGDRIVTVDINGRRYVRDVEIPASELFFVGLVDLTFGLREGGPQDSEADGYANGRLAFYTRGTTASGYTITGSVDTRDGPIEEMFDRLNDKEPRRVLDRIRTDGRDLYPTYGDDSEIFDDAPTSGATYLRVESDTLRFTLGDFRTGIAGPGLINNARDLYGVELAFRSPGVTSFGESLVAGNIYAAQPGTAAQRDILRGTGGSVYFLTRQDITGGSTTVAVQAIDPDTGFVVQSTRLAEGVDYTVDHVQGVIILTAPLSSSSGDGGLVNDGIGPNDVNLVVQYEYTPTAGLDDATAYGGRAEAWIADRLRLGASAMVETTDSGDDQRIASADLRYRLGAKSFAELEIARTEGPGFSRSTSTDGGLTIASTGGGSSDAAQALRFVAELDLQDLGLAAQGQIGLRYEAKDAGFSTLNEDISDDQVLFGIDGSIEVSDRLTLGFDAERFTSDDGRDRTKTEISAAYALSSAWTVAVGAEWTDKTTPGDPDQTGTRTDVGARLTYGPSADWEVYVFGQTTIETTGGLEDNHRFGLGGSAAIGDRFSVAGEVSDGDTGLAGELQLSYAASPNNEIYLGYTLDPTRSGAGSVLSDNGKVVVGGRHRQSDKLRTYAESIYDMPGDQRSLTQAYGVNYSPNTALTYGFGIETGRVRDSENGDFDRTAVSFGAAYARDDDLTMRARLEYRTEDGDGTAQDRDTIGVTAGYSNRVADDWRVLADLDVLYSESAEGDFRDGEYLRASLGYAYRPIDNERLNLLFRLTALHDLPGEDQVDANGNIDGPLQRSNVLAVSASYDLNPELTVGGKLGYRMSEVADRGTEDFTVNTATLLIGRVDWNVISTWDVLAEGRLLYTNETGTTETGAVAAIYRHIGDNLKVGVGYEWGAVSDDETDIDYDGQGIFLNIVGMF